MKQLYGIDETAHRVGLPYKRFWFLWRTGYFNTRPQHMVKSRPLWEAKEIEILKKQIGEDDYLNELVKKYKEADGYAVR